MFRKSKPSEKNVQNQESLKGLADAVGEFLNCTSLSQRYKLIIANPFLLDKQSEGMMHFALFDSKQVPKKVGEQIWKEVSSMLTECRQYGAETLLLKHHLRHAWETGSESLRAAIQNATNPPPLEGNFDSSLPHPELLRLWETLALHPDFANFPEPRAILLRQNAMAFYALFEATKNAALAYRAYHSLGALGVNGTKEDSYQSCLILNAAATCEHAATAKIEPLDQAIEESLKVVGCYDENSDEFAFLHDGIGRLLVDRSRQSGLASDLDQAVKHLTLSVEANDRSTRDSFKRVISLSTLGNAKLELFKRTQNLDALEEGISHLRKAVSIATPESVEMLDAASHLGLALKQKFQKTGILSVMKEALEYFEACVEPGSYGFEEDGAGRLDNFGTALREYAESLYYGGHVQESLPPLNRSIEVHRQALKLLGESKGPTGYLYGFLSNLGIALKDRAAIEPQESDLSEAIQCLERAVQLISPDGAFRCSLLNNLAMCQWSLYLDKNDSASRDNAIASMEQCIAAIIDGSSEQIEYLHRLASYKVARYEQTKQPSDLKESLVVLERAVTLAQETLDWAVLEYKLGQQHQDVPINDLLVQLHWAIGQECPEERELGAKRALELCESSKSRVLSSMLNYQDLSIPDGVPSILLEKERAHLQRLNELDREQLRLFGGAETGKSHGTNLAERRVEIDGLNAVWHEIKSLGEPAEKYVSLRRESNVSWESIANTANQLGKSTAMLSLFCSSGAIFVFVVKAGQTAPDVVRIPLTQAELRAFMESFETEITNWSTHRKSGKAFSHYWQELGGSLFVPVLPSIEGIDHLVISSHGQMHAFPLHALFVDKDRRCLIDDYAVSYIPSIVSLAHLFRKQPILSSDSFVLGYTQNLFERDVFIGEAESVAKITGGKLAVNQAASTTSVQRYGKQPLKLMHFSCHGAFSPESPLDSAIFLADGALTVRAWLALQIEVELVTLSACQVAQSGVLGGAEMAGFVQGILISGGRSALLGAWNVNALVTKMIMERFYQKWFSDGTSIGKAEALRRAVLELRDGLISDPLLDTQVDLADPYLWAAFCLHGAI